MNLSKLILVVFFLMATMAVSVSVTGTLLPEKCSFSVSVNCLDYSVTPTSIRLVLLNGAGRDMIVYNISATSEALGTDIRNESCSYVSDGFLLKNKEKGVFNLSTGTCNYHDTGRDKNRYQISASYAWKDSPNLNHVLLGELLARLGENSEELKRIEARDRIITSGTWLMALIVFLVGLGLVVRRRSGWVIALVVAAAASALIFLTSALEEVHPLFFLMGIILALALSVTALIALGWAVFKLKRRTYDWRVVLALTLAVLPVAFLWCQYFFFRIYSLHIFFLMLVLSSVALLFALGLIVRRRSGWMVALAIAVATLTLAIFWMALNH